MKLIEKYQGKVVDDDSRVVCRFKSVDSQAEAEQFIFEFLSNDERGLHGEITPVYVLGEDIQGEGELNEDE